MSDRSGSAEDLLLGVDIGGTKVLAGLVDRAGRIVERRQVPTRPAHLLADTEAACGALIETAASRGRAVAGIGIGAKGAVDSRRGVLVGSLYLGHGEIPMGAHLRQRFARPVRVENDVHAATIGERMFGVGRRVEDFILFNAGTGIALGIVAGGHLYRGASNTAGENGHAVMDCTARWPCPCGMAGCVETIIVAGRGGDVLPTLAGLDAGHLGIDAAYGYLASSLLDAVDLFDPAAVVLAGGMLNARREASRWLTEVVARRTGGSCLVLDAFAGLDAGLIGAAALVLGGADGTEA